MKRVRQRCLGMGLQIEEQFAEIAVSTGSEGNTSAMSGSGPANRGRSFINPVYFSDFHFCII